MYKYFFEKSPSKKGICPSCKQRTYRYMQDVDGNPIDRKFGRCERLNSCGYSLYPNKINAPELYNFGGRGRTFIKENDKYTFIFDYNADIIAELKKIPSTVYNASQRTWSVSIQYKAEVDCIVDTFDFEQATPKLPKTQIKKRLVVFYDNTVVLNSKKNILQNNLIKYLCGVFGQDYVLNALNKYDIGTNARGETLFWYKNIDGQFVCAKAIKYNEDGHRDKTVNPYYIYANKESKPQICYFGEHLLNASKPTVFIVESEKSAFVGEVSGAFSDEVFLASGSANGNTFEKMEIFDRVAGARVTLLPDADEVGREMFKKASCYDAFAYYDMFTTKNDGYDLADYLIEKKLNYKPNKISFSF